MDSGSTAAARPAAARSSPQSSTCLPAAQTTARSKTTTRSNQTGTGRLLPGAAIARMRASGLFLGKQPAQPGHPRNRGRGNELPGNREKSGEHREQAFLRGHGRDTADDQRGQAVLGNLVAAAPVAVGLAGVECI